MFAPKVRGPWSPRARAARSPASRPSLTALALLATLALSCARPHREPPPACPPADLPRAFWPESRLPPVARSTTLPSTHPAPLDALELFALARAATLEGRHAAAIPLLERAATLDPDSADVQLLLADARLITGGDPLPALARAAELRPDDLDLLLRLGQLQLDRNNPDIALLTLRRATLTPDYADSPTLTDLALARALATEGYDLAALARYDRVLTSLRSLGPRLDDSPELLLLAQRPEALYTEIAALYERNAQHADAARVLEQAVRRDPESFDLQAGLARALSRSGDFGKAADIARAQLVARGADAASVALLTDVHRLAGRESDLLADLRRLHAADPDDPVILFTLTGVLTATAHPDEADRLLSAALARGTGGLDTARRLLALRDSRGDLHGAARALVLAGAAMPQRLDTVALMLARLTDPVRTDRLEVPDLCSIPAATDADRVARDYLVARHAVSVGQGWIARERLRGIATRSVSALLLWAELEAQLRGPGVRSEVFDLASATHGVAVARVAEARVDPRLAGLHVGAYIDVLRAHPVDARTRVDYLRALQRGAEPEDFRLGVLVTLAAAGDEPAVIDFLASSPDPVDSAPGLRRDLRDGLAREPESPDAAALDARITFDLRTDADTVRASRAKAVALLDRFPGSEPAVAAAEYVLTSTVDRAAWESLVFQRAGAVPRALPVVRRAVADAVARGRVLDAERLITASRAALADDAELLYVLAQIARRAGLNSIACELLSEVLRLDPAHASAANDLAFDLADTATISGPLALAEQLARRAVVTDPGNPAFLDTLGLVLYKRRDFSASVEAFDLAAKLAPNNPALLDRLGDALHRDGRPVDALSAWRRASDSADSGPIDDLNLRLRLRKKIDQAARNEPPTLTLTPTP